MKKVEIITQIVNLKFPNSSTKRSLEARAIERCGYTKVELLKELQNLNQKNK